MKCVGCNDEVPETVWGNWCDKCGGVVIPGTPRARLFFRHVATVDGAGGRFPVVYDLSAEAYGVSWPKTQVMVTCVHCGSQTPGEDPRNGLTRLDDLRVPSNSRRGTLDAMIALIQPIARGDSEDLPGISAAPSSTPEERKTVLGE